MRVMFADDRTREVFAAWLHARGFRDFVDYVECESGTVKLVKDDEGNLLICLADEAEYAQD